MDTLEQAELSGSIRHIARFLKSGIPIYNAKSRIRLAEKQEKEEHRQLQSVLYSTRTQWFL